MHPCSFCNGGTRNLILTLTLTLMNFKLLEWKTEKHEIQVLHCGAGPKADENWMSVRAYMCIHTFGSLDSCIFVHDVNSNDGPVVWFGAD